MALPFFYVELIPDTSATIVLNEETSKHMVQVLRMNNGSVVQLANGRGKLATATIIDAHKKKCTVKIESVSIASPSDKKIIIGISLIKNASRFEWFLEKATEIGVAEIFPLSCDRTEKQHFRLERMRGILISAMLQSQQLWLPEIHEPVPLTQFIHQNTSQSKYIAYCGEEYPKQYLANKTSGNDAVILIGPEGDFTPLEVESSVSAGFIPVSLGQNRLRTETAGVTAAVLLNI